jgi:TRAP-type C4-dicarboxylate transport system permease small subunit
MVPVLVHTLPEQHHRWIQGIIDLSCKLTCIIVAWFLQRTTR